jgi:hypothetical protein
MDSSIASEMFELTGISNKRDCLFGGFFFAYKRDDVTVDS